MAVPIVKDRSIPPSYRRWRIRSPVSPEIIGTHGLVRDGISAQKLVVRPLLQFLCESVTTDVDLQDHPRQSLLDQQFEIGVGRLLQRHPLGSEAKNFFDLARAIHRVQCCAWNALSEWVVIMDDMLVSQGYEEPS